MDLEHPMVTHLRKHGLPDAEPIEIDYFGTEIHAGEYYFDFEDAIVHEDDLERYLYEVLAVRRKQA